MAQLLGWACPVNSQSDSDGSVSMLTVQCTLMYEMNEVNVIQGNVLAC